ncbi:MAG: GrpB family protein [Muribaculaceae bacterium]|nr:GrpB family protein [Muribaculaceae bacterium]
MKRLEDMTLEELWELFPIILTEPNPDWINWANEEMSYLQEVLGGLIAKISHIGSTAIRGIRAKPIIDIIIESGSGADFDIMKQKIIAAGYICMNEADARVDLNKGYTAEGFADRVFHVHLRLKGDNDEIYFRDYLNSHPDVAREYEKLKLALWKKYEHDRDGYTEAKSDFVRYYTSLAKAQS